MTAGPDPVGVPIRLQTWLERVTGLAGACRPAGNAPLPVQDGDQPDADAAGNLQ
ncbi:hypothetical protein [Sinosporangium siamense]|uniref:Uncharacterized protein n=1 Tax=Sinosporangium siamense TaxID=1367973 RepID=A0A919RPF0_9ACTN|nr:hypothetical protein [Sinosporangium siamense]GII95981.1 hypothetical protein Ssi02_62120 [Sinosporangium siamense]